jgi:hypothetical protein
LSRMAWKISMEFALRNTDECDPANPLLSLTIYPTLAQIRG